MDELAKGLLQKLLALGDKTEAGVRQRSPALTVAHMKPYRTLRNLHQKQACEEVFLAARDEGAVSLTRDKMNPDDGLVDRIDLLDIKILARFLGQTTHADQLEQARLLLEPLTRTYAVLDEVVAAWAVMKKVRGLGPEDVLDWIDAGAAIEASPQRTGGDSTPVRELSARLFRDSKRIEKLTVPLDVLLMGSVESASRTSVEVWQELGLFREEQPVYLAGHVQITRTRVTALLDEPFTGLPASTILKVSGGLEAILTIENLTTFHSEAKQGAEKPTLLIYTAGMPSPAWIAMYKRLLSSVPNTISVHHWGDVDEGGFRIAAHLATAAADCGHTLQSKNMSPEDVPVAMRRPASERTLLRILHFAKAAGWSELGARVVDAKFTVEQEAL